VGSLQLPVRYGEKTLPAFRFNVARRGTNLLGLDLFNCLGFTLLDTTGSEIHTVFIPWQQQWPALFSSVGCFEIFAHQPLIDPMVTPVIQPLRRSPLALRDDISSELQSMLDGDIIEQSMNASPWISNLVVANKKSGGLRPCVDLRAVNKAIIPTSIPFPFRRNSPPSSTGPLFSPNWTSARVTSLRLSPTKGPTIISAWLLV